LGLGHVRTLLVPHSTARHCLTTRPLTGMFISGSCCREGETRPACYAILPRRRLDATLAPAWVDISRLPGHDRRTSDAMVVIGYA
jgi:hypothetical protein